MNLVCFLKCLGRRKPNAQNRNISLASLQMNLLCCEQRRRCPLCHENGSFLEEEQSKFFNYFQNDHYVSWRRKVNIDIFP